MRRGVPVRVPVAVAAPVTIRIPVSVPVRVTVIVHALGSTSSSIRSNRKAQDKCHIRHDLQISVSCRV